MKNYFLVKLLGIIVKYLVRGSGSVAKPLSRESIDLVNRWKATYPDTFKQNLNKKAGVLPQYNPRVDNLSEDLKKKTEEPSNG